MTELARVLLRRGLDVTMVLIERPFGSSDSGAAATRRVMAANPAITFHVLPPDPSSPDFAGSTKLPFFHTLQLLRRYNGELGRFLRSIPRCRLHSVVTGMFSTYAAEVAVELGVPAYAFFASGAGILAVVAQLPALLAGRQEGLKVLGDAPLEFLGVPPIPASHMVKELLKHPEEDMCNAMVDVLKRIADTDGVLVNTFEALESRTVQALKDPRCVPARQCPRCTASGPWSTTARRIGRCRPRGGTSTSACRLGWTRSWSAASCTSASAARARSRRSSSGRSPSAWRGPGTGSSGSCARRPPKKFLEQRPKPDLAALLPAGFLERTRGRGLVVTSWAPQVAVLCHRSTGAFVMHCGWNSVLEAVAAGVPMLCWPLYSEQMLNKVLMTDLDMGVAWEMEGYAAGRVGADEVEAKLRLVMDVGVTGLAHSF
jgi:hypothetical protein